jgi:hypothetical protein
MSTCEQLRATAAGVATLPADDPERKSYLEHARGCPGCMEALRQGEKLAGLLERSALPPPSREALSRASAPILRALSFRSWPLRAAAALVAFAIPLLFSQHHDWEGWAAAAVVLALATALSATAGAVRAGAWIALAASAGFAIAAGGIPGFTSPAGLAPHIGLHCAGAEVLGAGLTVGLLLWRAGRTAVALPATAAAGALAAQAALHFVCRAHGDATHLWVFHTGTVAAAALIGWALQSRIQESSLRS